MVDWEILKKLIQMAKDEDVTGLTIEDKGIKYEVKRGSEMVPGEMPHITSHHIAAPAAPAAGEPKQEGEEDGIVAITSPMVGTFYRAPSPEAPPFVETGDEIEVGKVVCIVEAMKLFNEIESDVRGKVVKVLAENGKPVEYGQKLFLIKKA